LPVASVEESLQDITVPPKALDREIHIFLILRFEEIHSS